MNATVVCGGKIIYSSEVPTIPKDEFKDITPMCREDPHDCYALFYGMAYFYPPTVPNVANILVT